MKKFVELCKKPFLYASAALFVVFTVLLVVALVTPLGNTFGKTVNLKDMGDGMPDFSITQTLTFEKDGNASVGVKFNEAKYKDALKEVLGEAYTDEIGNQAVEALKNEVNDQKFEYTKENGKYVIKDYMELEVKGNKLVPVVPEGEEVTQEEIDEYTLTCTANSAVIIASAVLMGVSGIVLVGCVVVLVLDKKGVIKTGETKAEATEAAAE